ncbi:PQQ-binding-like beta-propeller repeat protein [Streptomyces sp. TRM 70351]|uniref:outer membrane protein assembly factor BamB family protein n=1 Tax=Streptomyces sp. TRM 70351 TaxID=3116552 RepID=UPI002E7C4302|nr:PQQ-binding-like beta-propeller repeat protein [Streptomyces sp. TRM 70351]MEE1929552.1 PQQ-binding-like beta-propeller repeat protein [Streptomyces sp. TRM 70351]
MVDQLTQHDPRRIGPFEVLGRLGAGGMGLVYLARSASGRRVAIKTVRTELAEDQLFRVRFTREVEAARAVSGFYTAAVVDADPRAAIPWLATAYVPAPSLEEIITECGPLPVQAVRWLAAGIAEALQSIHSAGLVHRDLKPSNVLVVEDGPRVIDFGIASGVSNTRLTMTNVAVGTPAYMSPEQAKDSRSVTGASDVFSLGSTLVYAGTGHAPYHGANPVETVFMLLREGPDVEGLPGELLPLIESCMHMEAERRPTPAQLQAELAPHLFSSGGDDSGTASAWLPGGAVELIERKRGGRSRPPHRPAPASGPPLSRPPAGPAVHGGHAGYGGGAAPGGGAFPGGDVYPGGGAFPAPPPAPPAAVGAHAAPPVPGAAPAPPGAPPPQADGASVRLPGTPAPIGPGPRRRDPHRPAPVPGTHWVRPPAGVAAAPHAPAPGPGAPAPAGTSGPGAVPPAPARRPPVASTPPPDGPGRWRPWRFRMSNDVWGTPAVFGDLVYVTSFEVHALDVTTGRRRFKTRDVAWSMAVADGRVHASDGPSLFALDAADGTERWKTSVEAWVYSLCAGDGVVVTGTRGGAVQAWDGAGGERLWELTGAQTDFETADTGPVLYEGTVYLWAEGLVYALDARSGDERWTYPVGDASATGGVPIRLLPAEDGGLYVCAGARLLALDAATGAERWRFHGPDPFLCPPAFAPGAAVAGGGVYVADYRGVVYAIDAANGHDRWRIPTQARASTEPVVVADGLVHVASGSALYTIDAVPGTGRWRFETHGELVGAPVAAQGRVHFGSADHSLYTLDAVGGQLRWKLETGGEITGTLLVTGGVVYACSKDRCVYALDAELGTRLPGS